jgi:hypothetical protein
MPGALAGSEKIAIVETVVLKVAVGAVRVGAFALGLVKGPPKGTVKGGAAVPRQVDRSYGPELDKEGGEGELGCTNIHGQVSNQLQPGIRLVARIEKRVPRKSVVILPNLFVHARFIEDFYPVTKPCS